MSPAYQPAGSGRPVPLSAYVNPLASVPLWVSGLVTTTLTAPAAWAGVVAVREVLLTTVTPVAAVPPKLTVAPVAKLVPVIVTAVPPAVGPLVGATPVTVGAGFRTLMVNVCPFDVPPPGVGLNTVTERVPPVAMSVAEMAPRNSVGETKVVVRLEPFQRTREVGTKLVPVTVRVNAVPPAVADVGLSPVVVGTGFTMVNVCPFEVPPPGVGLRTVTVRVAPEAMSAAVISAWSSVGETYVVERLEPAQRTTEVETKFVPVTVRVNAGPPAATEDGESPVVVGTGF
jgi:hypothetical protein